MKPIIIANWKMNPQTLQKAKQLFNAVKKGVKNIKRAEVIICPPSVYLAKLRPLSLYPKLGGQDCFWEQKGPYTGGISPEMIEDAGCKYIIVGHSERRRYFGESDEIVNKKLKAVLEAKLTPILCIGETQKEREQEKTESVLKNQIISALSGVSAAKFSKVVIAYEPVWAIGTGNPCSVEEAQKMGLLIRKIISEIYNQKIAKSLRILYGGSIDSKNSEGYIKEARLQGLLVGGASLDAKDFVKIVRAVS